jgi:rod shape-determining protein MreC
LERLSQRRTTLVLVVLASITLITFDLRGSSVIQRARETAVDVFAPVRSAARTVFSPVENTWHGIFDYDRVKRQRDALQDQVNAQEGAAIAAEAQIADYQELRALQNLPTPNGIKSVIAEVSSLPASNFDLSVELNQGSNEGLRRGMPVVTGAGLVGRLTDVSSDRAVLRLATDPEFFIGVKIAPAPPPPPPPTTPPKTTAPPVTVPATTTPTGFPTTTVPPPTTTVATTTTTAVPPVLEQGILRGQGTGKDLAVEDVQANSGAKVGDPVMTSGVRQSLAPPDLPVGRVSSVKRRLGSLNVDVRVKPSVDFAHLHYVKVLLYCADCAEG